MATPSEGYLCGMRTEPRVLSGRYRLGEQLGQGGCATVYAAVDEQLARDVAVKVWEGPSTEPVDEVRLTARLRHPGVVVVHDAHVSAELSYLVMERVRGCSLADALRDGPLPTDRAVRIVEQLARTLSHVHGDDVVHGDVKPANVMLGPGDDVTLTDFGVAVPSRTCNRSEARGTPSYLSPEQVRGLPVTAATDVYALGLVLLECLTGRRAFEGTPEEAAVARLLAPPQVPSRLPADLAALVRATTDPDPDARPAARDVADQLAVRAAAASELTAAVPVVAALPLPEQAEAEATGLVPVQPTPRRARWWLSLATSAGLVVAVLALPAQSTEGYGGPAPSTATSPAATGAPAAAPARAVVQQPETRAVAAVQPAARTAAKAAAEHKAGKQGKAKGKRR